MDVPPRGRVAGEETSLNASQKVGALLGASLCWCLSSFHFRYRETGSRNGTVSGLTNYQGGRPPSPSPRAWLAKYEAQSAYRLRLIVFLRALRKMLRDRRATGCCIMCQRPGPDLGKSEARTQSHNCSGVRNSKKMCIRNEPGRSPLLQAGHRL